MLTIAYIAKIGSDTLDQKYFANLALIASMKNNRLFLEFIEEVYMEKVRLGERELEPRDFRIFFNNKAEQSTKVAGWQESTLINANRKDQSYQAAENLKQTDGRTEKIR